MSSKASPSSKRIKLETSLPPSPSNSLPDVNDIETEDPEFQCSICLQDIVDRTVVPTCYHEFCFECVTMWAGECLSVWPIQADRGNINRAIAAVSTMFSICWGLCPSQYPFEVRFPQALFTSFAEVT